MVVKIDGMVVQTQGVVVVGLSYYFEQGLRLGVGYAAERWLTPPIHRISSLKI